VEGEDGNKTIGTKNQIMTISGCILFVDVADFSTGSTRSSRTYPINSIVYVRAVSTTFYLFLLWRTLVSSTNSTSVLHTYTGY
jgi:hypothetical protein